MDYFSGVRRIRKNSAFISLWNGSSVHNIQIHLVYFTPDINAALIALLLFGAHLRSVNWHIVLIILTERNKTKLMCSCEEIMSGWCDVSHQAIITAKWNIFLKWRVLFPLKCTISIVGHIGSVKQLGGEKKTNMQKKNLN